MLVSEVVGNLGGSDPVNCRAWALDELCTRCRAVESGVFQRKGRNKREAWDSKREAVPVECQEPRGSLIIQILQTHCAVSFLLLKDIPDVYMQKSIKKAKKSHCRITELPFLTHQGSCKVPCILLEKEIYM